MIKGKSPEEIRKTFNIKNDFTEEEEQQVLLFNCCLSISCINKIVFQVRRENQWCEEK